MTDRAAVIAAIRTAIVTHAGVENMPTDALLSLHEIDSLDQVEIGMTLEDELGLQLGTLEPAADWTIDTIADAVIAAQREGKL